MLFYGISRGIDRSSYSRHTRLGHLLFRLPKIYSPACVPTWILATYPNIMNSHDTVLMGSTVIPNLCRDWTGTTTCTCSHQHRIGIGLTGWDRKVLKKVLGAVLDLVGEGAHDVFEWEWQSYWAGGYSDSGIPNISWHLFWERWEECQDPPRCDDSIIWKKDEAVGSQKRKNKKAVAISKKMAWFTTSWHLPASLS